LSAAAHGDPVCAGIHGGRRKAGRRVACGCKLEEESGKEINPVKVVHLAKMLSFYDMRVKDVPVEIQILAYNIDLTKYEDCRLDLLPSILEFVKVTSR